PYTTIFRSIVGRLVLATNQRGPAAPFFIGYGGRLRHAVIRLRTDNQKTVPQYLAALQARAAKLEARPMPVFESGNGDVVQGSRDRDRFIARCESPHQRHKVPPLACDNHGDPSGWRDMQFHIASFRRNQPERALPWFGGRHPN